MPFKKTSTATSFQEIAANARTKSGITNNHKDDNFTTNFHNTNVSIKFNNPKTSKSNKHKGAIKANNSSDVVDVVEKSSGISLTIQNAPEAKVEAKVEKSSGISLTIENAPVQNDEFHTDKPKHISTSAPNDVEKPKATIVKSVATNTIKNDSNNDSNNNFQLNLKHENAQNIAQFITVADNLITDDSLTDDFINGLPIKNEYKEQIIKALEVSRRIETPPPSSGFISSIAFNIKPSEKFSPTGLINNDKKLIHTITEDTIVENNQSKSPVNSKLKTKICTFYLKGKCTKGDNCTFIHNEQIAESTKSVKDASKDVGKVVPPLCRYGQNCTHLANGECCFGHYKSLVMNFNLSRKQSKLPPVKVGAIYADIRHKESKKTNNHNTAQAIMIK